MATTEVTMVAVVVPLGAAVERVVALWVEEAVIKVEEAMVSVVMVAAVVVPRGAAAERVVAARVGEAEMKVEEAMVLGVVDMAAVVSAAERVVVATVGEGAKTVEEVTQVKAVLVMDGVAAEWVVQKEVEALERYRALGMQCRLCSSSACPMAAQTL